MKALEDVFAKTMPAGMGFDYMGMSFQEKVAAEGVSASVIFGFSLLFVFLILAAQYESWALPFSVLLGTPVAVFGAFGALWLLKLVAPQASENDVFTQIGLVMLIGLAAKNAILIVEFAKVEHEGGKPLIDAALAAARVRLRPILMTAFAFILGVVPLVLATGAGAHGRVLLGLAVFGGMLAASVIAIFLIPVTYYVVEKLSGLRDKTTPGAPASGTPETAGDGQRPKPALEPTGFPHMRVWREGIEMNRWLALLGLVVFMAGCSMGPDYARKDRSGEDAWRMAPATSESVANLPWWELLKDPELQRLIRTALEENQDVRTAAASIEEFQAQLVISRFDLAPSLGYGGQAFVYNAERNAVGIPLGGGSGVFIPGQGGQGGTTLSNESAYAGLKWESGHLGQDSPVDRGHASAITLAPGGPAGDHSRAGRRSGRSLFRPAATGFAN